MRVRIRGEKKKKLGAFSLQSILFGKGMFIFKAVTAHVLLFVIEFSFMKAPSYSSSNKQTECPNYRASFRFSFHR